MPPKGTTIAFGRIVGSEQKKKKSKQPSGEWTDDGAKDLVQTMGLDASAGVPYREQKNEEFYTKQALKDRKKLKKSKLIRRNINRVWRLMGKEESGRVSEQSYVDVMLRLCKVLNPDFNYKDALSTVKDDFKRDSHGGQDLTYEQFFESLFELADIWSPDIQEATYAEFLDKAFRRISVKIVKNKEGKRVKIKPAERVFKRKLTPFLPSAGQRASTSHLAAIEEESEAEEISAFSYSQPSRSRDREYSDDELEDAYYELASIEDTVHWDEDDEEKSDESETEPEVESEAEAASPTTAKPKHTRRQSTRSLASVVHVVRAVAEAKPPTPKAASAKKSLASVAHAISFASKVKRPTEEKKPPPKSMASVAHAMRLISKTKKETSAAQEIPSLSTSVSVVTSVLAIKSPAHRNEKSAPVSSVAPNLKNVSLKSKRKSNSMHYTVPPTAKELELESQSENEASFPGKLEEEKTKEPLSPRTAGTWKRLAHQPSSVSSAAPHRSIMSFIGNISSSRVMNPGSLLSVSLDDDSSDEEKENEIDELELAERKAQKEQEEYQSSIDRPPKPLQFELGAEKDDSNVEVSVPSVSRLKGESIAGSSNDLFPKPSISSDLLVQKLQETSAQASKVSAHSTWSGKQDSTILNDLVASDSMRPHTVSAEGPLGVLVLGDSAAGGDNLAALVAQKLDLLHVTLDSAAAYAISNPMKDEQGAKLANALAMLAAGSKLPDTTCATLLGNYLSSPAVAFRGYVMSSDTLVDAAAMQEVVKTAPGHIWPPSLVVRMNLSEKNAILRHEALCASTLNFPAQTLRVATKRARAELGEEEELDPSAVDSLVKETMVPSLTRLPVLGASSQAVVSKWAQEQPLWEKILAKVELSSAFSCRRCELDATQTSEDQLELVLHAIGERQLVVRPQHVKGLEDVAVSSSSASGLFEVLAPVPLDPETTSLKENYKFGVFQQMCPVSLLEDQKMTVGSPAFAATWRGTTYLMASEKNLQQFLVNPIMYTLPPVLPTPLLLLLTGADKVGKTSIAQRLQEAFDWKIVAYQELIEQVTELETAFEQRLVDTRARMLEEKKSEIMQPDGAYDEEEWATILAEQEALPDDEIAQRTETPEALQGAKGFRVVVEGQISGDKAEEDLSLLSNWGLNFDKCVGLNMKNVEEAILARRLPAPPSEGGEDAGQQDGDAEEESPEEDEEEVTLTKDEQDAISAAKEYQLSALSSISSAAEAAGVSYSEVSADGEFLEIFDRVRASVDPFYSFRCKMLQQLPESEDAARSEDDPVRYNVSANARSLQWEDKSFCPVNLIDKGLLVTGSAELCGQVGESSYSLRDDAAVAAFRADPLRYHTDALCCPGSGGLPRPALRVLVTGIRGSGKSSVLQSLAQGAGVGEERILSLAGLVLPKLQERARVELLEQEQQDRDRAARKEQRQIDRVAARAERRRIQAEEAKAAEAEAEAAEEGAKLKSKADGEATGDEAEESQEEKDANIAKVAAQEAERLREQQLADEKHDEDAEAIAMESEVPVDPRDRVPLLSFILGRQAAPLPDPNGDAGEGELEAMKAAVEHDKKWAATPLWPSNNGFEGHDEQGVIRLEAMLEAKWMSDDDVIDMFLECLSSSSHKKGEVPLGYVAEVDLSSSMLIKCLALACERAECAPHLVLPFSTPLEIATRRLAKVWNSENAKSAQQFQTEADERKQAAQAKREAEDAAAVEEAKKQAEEAGEEYVEEEAGEPDPDTTDYLELVMSEFESQKEEAIAILSAQAERSEAASSTLMEAVLTAGTVKILDPIDGSRSRRLVLRATVASIQPFLQSQRALFTPVVEISRSDSESLLATGARALCEFGCACPVELSSGKVRNLRKSKNPITVAWGSNIVYLSNDACHAAFIQDVFKYITLPAPAPSVATTVCVIGPPLSGKSTLAKTLEKDMDLVALDMITVLKNVSERQDTELGKKLQKVLLEGVVPSPELKVLALKMMTESARCRMNGWVLDGFPATLEDVEELYKQRLVPSKVIALSFGSGGLKEVLLRQSQLELSRARKFLESMATVAVDAARQELSQKRYLGREFDESEGEMTTIFAFLQREFDNLCVINPLGASRWKILDRAKSCLETAIDARKSHFLRISQGEAASIASVPLSRDNLSASLSKFGDYCPVAWLDTGALSATGKTGGFGFVAEYKGKFYKMASPENLEKFLLAPDKYASGESLPKDLPYKLTFTETQLLDDENCSLLGHCPVSLIQSRVLGPSGQKIIEGSSNCAVSYKGQVFRFISEAESTEFLSYPEKYAHAKLPRKMPPKVEKFTNIELLNMGRTLAYLEQSLASLLTKSFAALGSCRAKYPGLSTWRSALIFLSLFLKAHHPNSPGHQVAKYKAQLERFKSHCTTVTTLGNHIRKGVAPASLSGQHAIAGEISRLAKVYDYCREGVTDPQVELFEHFRQYLGALPLPHMKQVV